jgi:hypothetical protein
VSRTSWENVSDIVLGEGLEGAWCFMSKRIFHLGRLFFLLEYFVALSLSPRLMYKGNMTVKYID